MSPKQKQAETRPTNGELSIMFDNLCEKVDNLNVNIAERFNGIDDRMSTLQEVVVDLREFKVQVNSTVAGIEKSSRAWFVVMSSVLSILVAVSWFALNGMLTNMEQRIMQWHTAEDIKTRKEITNYIETRYDVTDVTIK